MFCLLLIGCTRNEEYTCTCKDMSRGGKVKGRLPIHAKSYEKAQGECYDEQLRNQSSTVYANVYCSIEN